MVGIAADARGAAFHVGIEGAARLDRPAGGEHHFGGFGRELAAGVEAPACTITGQPWMGRAILSGPLTFRYLPLWFSTCSRAGSK